LRKACQEIDRRKLYGDKKLLVFEVVDPPSVGGVQEAGGGQGRSIGNSPVVWNFSGMPPTLTWLDYCAADREKMLDVINLFDEKGTTDELGLGTIRDALATMLFPGTSTIQTRARYFFFVPWIYLGLEKRKVPSVQVSQEARKAEVRLIDALAAGGEEEGTIGIMVRASLKRLPSAVYWSGLSRLGILRFQGSQDQYHRAFDSLLASKRRIIRDDDGYPAGGGTFDCWDPSLPAPPGDFPSVATFTLSKEEASYLKDRILTSAPRAMLAQIVQRRHPWEDSEFPWEYPMVEELSERVQAILAHGRNFSETMHGAYLLYNLILARESTRDAYVEHYTAELQEWAQEMEERAEIISRWPLDGFWALCGEMGSIPMPTRRFVMSWLSLVFDRGRASHVATDEEAARLVKDREIALKGALARVTNKRALGLWNGAAGTRRLNYRWRVAQRISRDILAGTSGGT